MSQANSLSIAALTAAIVAIGLGIAALVLALDDDDPRIGLGAPITVQPRFQERAPQPDQPRVAPRVPDLPRDRILPGTPRLGLQVASTDDGLAITGVLPGSPAAAAGLETGDVITAIDGVDVTIVAEALRVIAAAEPGEAVDVTYMRDGESRSTSVELQNTFFFERDFTLPFDTDDLRERARRALEELDDSFQA